MVRHFQLLQIRNVLFYNLVENWVIMFKIVAEIELKVFLKACLHLVLTDVLIIMDEIER